MTETVRWMVNVSCPGENGGDAYHQEDLPRLEFWHPTKEAGQAAAQSWLRERMESGDSRDWMAFGHPDPYEVGARRIDGGEWLGPGWILRSSQLSPLPKDKWKNRINRALEWLKWFKEIVRSAAAMEKVIEWLQEAMEWLPFFRDRSSNRRGDVIVWPRRAELT